MTDPRLAIRLHDDVLADPVAYAQRARGVAFGDLPAVVGTLHGVAPCPDPELPAWMAARYPTLTITRTGFRRSPHGQREPTFVHSDARMGDWAGILYLTPDPPPEDGTVFYREIATGAVHRLASEPDEVLDEWITWADLDRWEPWTRVEARFGRLVLFPSAYLHARALRENYGAIADGSARLIQVLFGTGALPERES